MVTVAENPRLLVTVRLHEAWPHGSLMWSLTPKLPLSEVTAFGWFEKITLPVEVTDADQSKLTLASYPETFSRNKCPL
jgi:hypothetical protein